jgi:hypothetical protein
MNPHQQNKIDTSVGPLRPPVALSHEVGSDRDLEVEPR